MSALFAKRFYEGGFEDKMTRREAALILGVRCVLFSEGVGAGSWDAGGWWLVGYDVGRLKAPRFDNQPNAVQGERLGAADQGGAPAHPHAEPPRHGRLHLPGLQDQRGAFSALVKRAGVRYVRRLN